MKITTTKDIEDLNGILKLQKQNLADSLSPTEILQSGFVTVDHSFDQLLRISRLLPQIIAKDAKQVIGYALAMDKSLANEVEALKPMFEIFKDISWKEKKLYDSKFYVMGQVCIHKDYRRKGLFKKLYAKHVEVFRDQFEICVTEISTQNLRSMNAHYAAGFELAHNYSDQKDNWNIVLLDLRKE